MIARDSGFDKRSGSRDCIRSPTFNAILSAGVSERTSFCQYKHPARSAKMSKSWQFESYINHRLKTTLTHNYNHLKYIQPATRIDAYKFSFYPNVIQQWNNLPDEVVSAQSIDLFRLKLLNFNNL